MLRCLPFLTIALVLGCTDSDAPIADVDGGLDSGTPGPCADLAPDEVDISLTGTSPQGDGGEFTTACGSATGWGDCSGGEVQFLFAEPSSDDGGLPYAFEVELRFDGVADDVAGNRDCELSASGTTSTTQCSFNGSIDLNGATDCSHGYNGTRIQGTFSVDADGYDLASSIDVVLCHLAVCI